MEVAVTNNLSALVLSHLTTHPCFLPCVLIFSHTTAYRPLIFSHPTAHRVLIFPPPPSPPAFLSSTATAFSSTLRSPHHPLSPPASSLPPAALGLPSRASGHLSPPRAPSCTRPASPSPGHKLPASFRLLETSARHPPLPHPSVPPPPSLSPQPPPPGCTWPTSPNLRPPPASSSPQAQAPGLLPPRNPSPSPSSLPSFGSPATPSLPPTVSPQPPPASLLEPPIASCLLEPPALWFSRHPFLPRPAVSPRLHSARLPEPPAASCLPEPPDASSRPPASLKPRPTTLLSPAVWFPTTPSLPEPPATSCHPEPPALWFPRHLLSLPAGDFPLAVSPRLHPAYLSEPPASSCLLETLGSHPLSPGRRLPPGCLPPVAPGSPPRAPGRLPPPKLPSMATSPSLSPCSPMPPRALIPACQPVPQSCTIAFFYCEY